MAEIDPQIDELERRLDNLIKTQISFQTEISAIRTVLAELRRPQWPKTAETAQFPVTQPLVQKPDLPPVVRHVPPVTQKLPPEEPPPSFGTEYGRSRSYSPPPETPRPEPSVFSNYVTASRADMEKFIGQNLISLIGIIILILGVGIGAKYAIDNGFISPLMRIVFGYVVGLGLLGFAIRLKEKYLTFSAVLISGSAATLYFVTYFGYAYYSLIPQPIAFGMMVVFTFLTVAAALIYNRQVIAHIGLVGAYAVPFLLSNDSGQYTFLFIYISIINLGVLAISIRKNWKPLFYTASGFTWLIFAVWFGTKYEWHEHLYLALTFLGIFFAIFYAARVAHGLFHSERDEAENLISTVVTAVIFYGFVFAISSMHAGVFEYAVFFTYLAAATLAILVTAFRYYGRKYWIALFYSASAFTWLTLMAWFTTKYRWTEHLYLALTFLAIFFAIFYIARIANALLDKESNDAESILATAVTVAIFYAFLFAISDMHADVFEYTIVFSYLAVASLMILLTSFHFYGRILNFVSYPFTWLIFGAWFLSKYNAAEYFTLAAIFACVFFAIFYGATLIYRLATDEIGMIENASLVLTNSFVFYGFGYAILDSRQDLQPFEGLFTAAHGVFHAGVAQLVNRFKASAIDVVQVLAVLIITFTTIAIPVQLDGNYVTLVWTVEAATLFYFGRARGVRLFEYFSYPLMVLASGSLGLEWATAFFQRTDYPSPLNLSPIVNGDFVTTLVFVAGFAFIYVINRNKAYEPAIKADLVPSLGMILATVALVALYNAFRVEIGNYYHLRIAQNGTLRPDGTIFDSSPRTTHILSLFNSIWQLNYTMFFLTVLGAANLRKIRSQPLAYANVVFAVVLLLIFSTIGMNLLYELRLGYMDQDGIQAGTSGLMNIAIRYISYAVTAALVYCLFEYSRGELLDGSVPAASKAPIFDAILHSTVFIAASCELSNLMAQFHLADASKLGLSILWGVYALFLIVLGIAHNKKYLRISAIVILAVTLVKLFFYDIADLPTIPKTILFVSLGLLLLLISFLYTKYKDVIFRATVTDEEN